MKFWALSYSLPANPSRYRVAVWKKLKEIGAVYLQPAVAVVPQREVLFDALNALKDTIRSYGGKSAVLTLDFADKEDEAAMLAQINQSRTEEYYAIAHDVRRLAAQLDWEKKNGEIDEKYFHQELSRLQKRLVLAKKHDFFGAEGRHEADDAVEIITGMIPQTGTAKKDARQKPAVKPTKPTAVKPTAAAAVTPEPVSPVSPVSPVATEETPAPDMPVFLF